MHRTLSARPMRAVVIGAGMLLTLVAAPAAAAEYSDWSTAAAIETLPGSSSAVNTAWVDGCPIESPDGLSLYLASTRPGGVGGIDIWVAHRPDTGTGFGTPVNLGAGVNSGADDFCPTPVPGKGLFFVSTRGGNADIYFVRNNPAHAWIVPVRLGGGVNSALPELSPSLFEADGRTFLYFSRGADIYSAELGPDGWGSVGPVPELNSASGDFRPNVRKDGLEIVFDSNRASGVDQDLYFATRSGVDAPWSTPFTAGAAINTAANETRGSFSRDGSRLLFGRAPAPEGMSDIYFSVRAKVTGH